MSILLLDEGIRTARKEHWCYDCRRPIARGESYKFTTCKADDIYTLHHHFDCRMAVDFYMKRHGLRYRDFEPDGIPPLEQMIAENGEYQADLNMLRGHFPHVVCRLELSAQFADMCFGEWEGM